MVTEDLRPRGIADAAVLEAMAAVPREAFVPEALVDVAYRDSPLPIDEGQSISQPYVVALMAQALELPCRARVLEIGAGSGYTAAVLGHLARQVYCVERHASLVLQARQRLRRLGLDHVRVHFGDGSQGWPEAAPYHGIVVSAAATEVPESLKCQLRLGGHLVIPVGVTDSAQRLVRITRLAEDEFDQEDLGAVQFVPLIT